MPQLMHRLRKDRTVVDTEAHPGDPHVQPNGTSHLIISLLVHRQNAHRPFSTDEIVGSRPGDDTGPTRNSASESFPDHDDFGDSANSLWSLYAKEAESHDKAAVGSVKKHMDGALIFVRSYSSTR